MARPSAMEQSTAQGRNLGMIMADLVRRGQAAGELRRGVVPEVAGAVLVASYFTIVNIWATGSERFDLTDVVDQSLKIVLHGLKKE